MSKMIKQCLVPLLFIFFSKSLSATELQPYIVYLKGSTVLKKINDNSQVILSKGIYAKVLELDPHRRNQFYVYDKKGVATYLTSSEGIVEISEDIRLLPNVDAQKIYPPQSAFKATDAKALFDSQFNLHFEALQLSALNDIYKDLISNVLSTRYEARTLYDSSMPFKFGLSLNYQSAYWTNTYETVKLSILSFGPHFKYDIYDYEDINVHLIFGAEIAPLYEGSTTQFKDKYSAQLFDFGVESEWLTSFGIVTFGGHLRHHRVALTETTRLNVNLTPKEFSINSLGFMVGHKFEWEL